MMVVVPHSHSSMAKSFVHKAIAKDPAAHTVVSVDSGSRMSVGQRVALVPTTSAFGTARHSAANPSELSSISHFTFNVFFIIIKTHISYVT